MKPKKGLSIILGCFISLCALAALSIGIYSLVINMQTATTTTSDSSTCNIHLDVLSHLIYHRKLLF